MTVLPPSATTLTLLWNLSVLPDGSNTTLTLPLAPGETGSMLQADTIHPHEESTSSITKGVSETFVNVNVWLTGPSFSIMVPKSCETLSNTTGRLPADAGMQHTATAIRAMQVLIPETAAMAESFREYTTICKSIAERIARCRQRHFSCRGHYPCQDIGNSPAGILACIPDKKRCSSIVSQ